MAVAFSSMGMVVSNHSLAYHRLKNKSGTGQTCKLYFPPANDSTDKPVGSEYQVEKPENCHSGNTVAYSRSKAKSSSGTCYKKKKYKYACGSNVDRCHSGEGVEIHTREGQTQ